jgi:hypothetical protein
MLLAAKDPADVRSEAAHLLAVANADGLEVCCGYASATKDASAIEVIAAAEAALAFARRIGPGTVIG